MSKKKLPAKPVIKRASKKDTKLQLPPDAGANIREMSIAMPNPVNAFFYNSDQAYQHNPEDAERMQNDLVILHALRERQLATAQLPFSILPFDEGSPDQEKAAEEIEKVIKRTPYLTEFIRCLLDAIFWGRSAIFVEYKYDFTLGIGRKRLLVNNWFPVHGDSMLFGDDGEIGYRVGLTQHKGVTGDVITTVEGRGRKIDKDKRGAWILHHHEKQAGNFHDVRSAGNIFGVGLRSRIFHTWYIKSSLWQFRVKNAELFAQGLVIVYFDKANPDSADAMRIAMEKQIGSAMLLIPRDAGGLAAEGIEVVDPPSGQDLMESIKYLDDQIALVILGQTLTTGNEGGSGLGSNLADVHQNTFGRRIKYDAMALQETLSHQFVKILQEENGYGHLPPLRWEFSFDVAGPKEKLENAQILDKMKVPVAKDELAQQAGFTIPTTEEITT